MIRLRVVGLLGVVTGLAGCAGMESRAPSAAPRGVSGRGANPGMATMQRRPPQTTSTSAASGRGAAGQPVAGRTQPGRPAADPNASASRAGTVSPSRTGPTGISRYFPDLGRPRRVESSALAARWQQPQPPAPGQSAAEAWRATVMPRPAGRYQGVAELPLVLDLSRTPEARRAELARLAAMAPKPVQPTQVRPRPEPQPGSVDAAARRTHAPGEATDPSPSGPDSEVAAEPPPLLEADEPAHAPESPSRSLAGDPAGPRPRAEAGEDPRPVTGTASYPGPLFPASYGPVPRGDVGPRPAVEPRPRLFGRLRLVQRWREARARASSARPEPGDRPQGR